MFVVHDRANKCASDLNFCMGLYTKGYMATATSMLKRPFLHHLVIFKYPVTFSMLSTGLLMQGQIFADSH